MQHRQIEEDEDRFDGPKPDSPSFNAYNERSLPSEELKDSLKKTIDVGGDDDDIEHYGDDIERMERILRNQNE